jgi:alpha-beta hydrolase superfamily lysophospholipase
VHTGKLTALDASPSESGRLEGLAYTLWLPSTPREDRAGIVILHGAGSCKENHHDYARLSQAAGFAAVCFDQRGHGQSEGAMGAGAARDVTAIAALLRGRIGSKAPIALRGSSMGGYLAIVSAQLLDAAALVAICPAGTQLLRSGLAARTFSFSVDEPAFASFLASNDLFAAAQALAAPLLIVHAEADERVPVSQSRELAQHVRAPGSRLIVIAGGDHRSIQHDPQLQALSLRFIEDALDESSAAQR